MLAGAPGVSTYFIIHTHSLRVQCKRSGWMGLSALAANVNIESREICCRRAR